jgi:hypothetical protein
MPVKVLVIKLVKIGLILGGAVKSKYMVDSCSYFQKDIAHGSITLIEIPYQKYLMFPLITDRIGVLYVPQHYFRSVLLFPRTFDGGL